MGEPSQTRFEIRTFASGSIDAAAGIIRGVSVISVGEAKGHGLFVDQTTLAQVKAAAEAFKGGLKVKVSTQQGHRGDFAEIAGRLTNFRIAGDQLLADLLLLENTPHRSHILEVAEKMPDTCGLSIAFSGPTEKIGAKRYARCVEIYSADLVGNPAANPTGLFEAKPASASGDNPEQPKPNTTMDEKELSSLKDTLNALSARLEKIEKASTPTAPKPEELQANLAQVAELAAENAMKKFAAKLGTLPVAPSAEPKKPDDKPKTFEQLVREHPKYSENKALAVNETVAANQAAHSDYVHRCHNRGEVTMF